MSLMKIRKDRQASITIKFASPADALNWVNQAQEKGLLQMDAGVFPRDQLDETVGESGVPGSNRFVVRRQRSRANEITEKDI